MDTQNTYLNPSRERWNEIVQRPLQDAAALESAVNAILQEVKSSGDEALKAFALRFDGAAPADLKVTNREFEDAVGLVSSELKNAINTAFRNIQRFHETQMNTEAKVSIDNGITCWRRSVPIERVGLYIPGGSAPLFSTLLMLGIPAKIAGCREIIVCTPCNRDGKVNPVVLYVASLIGTSQVYKTGGAQAIAAMAFGTESIPAVSKIFGPGNQYVTAAKQLVSKNGIAIDMPAGPSEVAIYADTSCIPAYVAADLLSQAEHGADSQVMLVASETAIIENVKIELENQLESLPRKDIAAASLLNSRWIVMEDITNAFELLNMYAPEHLIIASGNAPDLAERVINAGSVFLGNYSPESAGDYASGTNHTLPTNGYARAYSGVSVDSFVKKITMQELTASGLDLIGDAIEVMARAEGLEAHANAVAIRRKLN